MKKMPWNEEIVTSAFWDADFDGGEGREFTTNKTLKDTISNFSGMKFEYGMRHLCTAVAMLMTEVEKLSQENQKLKDQLGLDKPEPFNPTPGRLARRLVRR